MLATKLIYQSLTLTTLTVASVSCYSSGSPSFLEPSKWADLPPEMTSKEYKDFLELKTTRTIVAECANVSSSNEFAHCATERTESNYYKFEHDSYQKYKTQGTPVAVSVYPTALLGVDEEVSQVLIKFDVFLVWHDPRLIFENASFLNNGAEVPEKNDAKQQRNLIQLSSDRIWTPTLRIVQSTGSVDPKQQLDEQHDSVSLRANGVIHAHRELIDWHACHFSSVAFPMAVHVCDIVITSPQARLRYVNPDFFRNDRERNYIKFTSFMRGAASRRSGEWTMQRNKSQFVQLDYIDEPWNLGVLKYRIVMVRNALPSAVTWIVMPGMLVLTSVLTVFFVCQETERCSFVGGTVVALFLLAISLGDQLSTAGDDELPIILKWYIACALVLFSLQLTCKLPETVQRWNRKKWLSSVGGCAQQHHGRICKTILVGQIQLKTSSSRIALTKTLEAFKVVLTLVVRIFTKAYVLRAILAVSYLIAFTLYAFVEWFAAKRSIMAYLNERNVSSDGLLSVSSDAMYISDYFGEKDNN